MHPGGHIKKGESPEKAAERECYEETHIKCKAIGDAFSMHGYKGIAFVPCKVISSNQRLENNSEFAALGFFKITELQGLKIFKNVRKLIDRAKRC